jgi:23S rRNA (adenine2503-C2)-methyltransferase
MSVREKLAGNYEIGVAPPVSEAVSIDGTKKYLFSSGERSVETAWIPENSRGTLCVSTQIGCRRGCRFCMTARQGFQGNLSAGEILNQYRSLPEHREVTHFVFMGMGEPLDNLESVLSTLEILTSDWGFGFSPKKVTVSTIGVIDGLQRLLDLSECRLALSLHSPFPDQRAELIPYERRYPAKQVLEIFRKADLGKRRLTIEYLMLDGRNDTPAHSGELARILKGMNTRVNLIPYHPIPDFEGTPSPPERIEAFRDDLNNRGLTATIRKSRGLDIDAACGLLSTLRSNHRKPGDNS